MLQQETYVLRTNGTVYAWYITPHGTFSGLAEDALVSNKAQLEGIRARFRGPALVIKNSKKLLESENV